MPCSGDPPASYGSYENAEKIYKYNRLLSKYNNLTRAACDMRTILRRNNLESELTEETKAWIRSHDKVDKERIRKEVKTGERDRIRKRALAKLNLDERRALGL